MTDSLRPNGDCASAPSHVTYISAEQTLPVRASELRPNWPPKDCVFPGDEDPETTHLGAFCNGRLVGIASLYHGAQPGPHGAFEWQLRGMAVLPEMRRRGIGRGLIDGCVAHVRAKGGRIIWCKARLSAAEFYVALEFRIVSDLYEIEGFGPHYVMEREVG